ncbi:MAG: hypothetical protein IJ744_06140 [Lachnospiraceae bacterium]|nr:hypothetical protein [Lachnospiraceae bacterium]
MAKEIYHALSDPMYQEPIIDVEEMRSHVLSDGTELAYRYVHGSFRGTTVKFIFCFPRRDAFKGRFFQYLSPFPGPDEELASLNKKGVDDVIGFSLLNGGYFVESNMGSVTMFGPNGDDKMRWKSSAAVAEFGRKKAMEIYGCERPVGVVFGGSGGGYKTMACIENTDAWDGAVPFVIGSPASLPNTITMHAQGQRVLRNCFGKIIDNIDAGGCGDPYNGLNEDEAAMLKELTKMGFPPMAWYLEASGKIDDGSLPVLTPGVKMADPGFFKEFWEVEGYAGADPNSSASKDRLQFDGVVKRVHLPGKPESADEENEIEGRNGVDDAWKKMLTDGKDAWIELEKLPEGDNLYLKGVNMTFETGEAVGYTLLLGDMQRDETTGGGFLTIGMCYGMSDLNEVLALVKPGDVMHLDNSDYIAIQHYYRHQVPDETFHAWDQFRNPDGTPALPQRANVMGYSFTGTGTVQDGNIQGKVMVIQSLMDESTCPWCGDWYRQTVRKAQGNEDNFRLYYMQRCMHGNTDTIGNNMVVNYMGALYQALLDMMDWIQFGKEPRATTKYELVEGQIVEEADASKRNGLQAGVTLTANGQKCVHVRAGGEFVLRTEAVLPEGAGEITRIAFDFQDRWGFPEKLKGLFPVQGHVNRTEKDGVKGAWAEIIYRFDDPGTYFVSTRVSSQRDGNKDEIYTQIKNLDRVRVIVE